MANGLLDPQDGQQPSPGVPVTLPNGLQGVWGVDANGKYVIYDANTWGSGNPIVIGQAGANGQPIAGAPLPTSNSTAAPPTAAPAAMSDWTMPNFPATYAWTNGVGGYANLGQQMAFDGARRMLHNPLDQQFGRFDFGQPMQNGWPQNTPNIPPVIPPTNYPPIQTGGSGGIGGIPGLGGGTGGGGGGIPSAPPSRPPGTTTGNPLERTSTPNVPTLPRTPGTSTGNPLERGSTPATGTLSAEQMAALTAALGESFAGLIAPLNGPYGGTATPPATSAPPSRPPGAGGGGSGNVRTVINDAPAPAPSPIMPSMYGLLGSTPIQSSQQPSTGLLGTADAAKAPAKQDYTSVDAFRFSGQTPQEMNYNYLAQQYNPQIAGAYLASLGGGLNDALYAQTQGTPGLAQQIINAGGAGGTGSRYSGGGVSPDGGLFGTSITPEQAQAWGWKATPGGMNMYMTDLPYKAAAGWYSGAAGTPVGNSVASMLASLGIK